MKHEAADVTFASWEDPHPGERLQIPLGMSAGLHIYSQTISGNAMGGVATTSPLHFLPLSEPLPRLDFETDTETEVGVETATLTGDTDTDRTGLTAVSQPHLSDFSNYLGISQREEDDASVTVVDSDTFMRANSDDDLYGWEAELDRKMKCRISTDSTCPCQYEYQRTDGGRRSLLHRVFSAPGRRASGF
ncbi:hypothetical protein M434DRAFT_126777 [Hypoxylon sp. CO27-5]|nr:hypothetical protein M434DRAFT_126777 [Hypoxylon sp. CO27-5]